MKTVALLLIGTLAVDVHAECSYFRVSSDLLQCAAADARTVRAADAYQAPSDLPELEETGTPQVLVQVGCRCEYSLMGADPRCDTEQALEKSSVIGAESPSTTCRRGRTLCRDLCPPRLP